MGRRSLDKKLKKWLEETLEDFKKNPAKAEKKWKQWKGKIFKIISGLSGGPLSSYLCTLKAMYWLVQSYFKGEYRNLPWRTIAAIIAVLIYVANPLDFVPDYIPFIGQIDDLMVLRWGLGFIRRDLVNYMKWRDSQGMEVCEL